MKDSFGTLKKYIITEFQSGFRHQRSTNDHLVRLETFIREAFIKKEHLVAVFFDLEKAYDTTWKYGIMNDLHEIGLKGRLPTFVQNFLSNREFKVRVGSTLSEAHNQEQGVPQGSILSVTLFTLKINNIVKCLNPGVDCSLYVDDFLICYRSKNMNTIERQLQLNLNKIQKWSTENGFKFSKSKTVCMHFCHLRKAHDDPILTLDGTPWVNFQCRGVLQFGYSRARAYCARSRCGWGVFGHFYSQLSFSPLSPSLWETARYRLKYCLKGPLNPKQPTNQPSL